MRWWEGTARLAGLRTSVEKRGQMTATTDHWDADPRLDRANLALRWIAGALVSRTVGKRAVGEAGERCERRIAGGAGGSRG
eukprot:1234051-Rhodomonas_salina.2